jgi:hypothetical protein
VRYVQPEGIVSYAASCIRGLTIQLLPSRPSAPPAVRRCTAPHVVDHLAPSVPQRCHYTSHTRRRSIGGYRSDALHYTTNTLTVEWMGARQKGQGSFAFFSFFAHAPHTH